MSRRAPVPLVPAILLVLSLFVFARCAGRHASTARPAEDALTDADVELLRLAYVETRAAADSTDALVILADDYAMEADIQALAGAIDEAAELWTEAIILLESADADTTLGAVEQR